jgi:hypothetical protein
MEKYERYSRDSFDNADREEQSTLRAWGEDIARTPVEKLREDITLPTERPYFTAVERKSELHAEAANEAHRLEEKRQELIRAVEEAVARGDEKAIEDAQTYLHLFEKHELDMHGGRERSN